VPAATYRLRLERETDNLTICTWGKISEARVRPLLRTLKTVLPFMGQAARAKRALAELLGALV
jgi:hypothetical protein